MQIEIDYGLFEEELADIAFADLVEYVLKQEGVPESTELSLVFIPNDEIAALNSEYRGINRPTDVLSFECDSLEEIPAERVASGEPFLLGDIMIAPEVARAQAEEYGMSYGEELSFLLVHGLLHLCGYDHIEDADAQVMEDREQELFQQWFKTDKPLR